MRETTSKRSHGIVHQSYSSKFKRETFQGKGTELFSIVNVFILEDIQSTLTIIFGTNVYVCVIRSRVAAPCSRESISLYVMYV